MKFYEKLIILRKKALLSQEELAEKLDVTRQTISKWELGQSKPDIDKLQMMSKLFEVDVNTLTNEDKSLEDSVNIKKEESPKKKKNGDRKFILYILIIIFIASLALLAYRVGTDIKTKKDEIKEELRKEKEKAEKEEKEFKDKFNKDMEESDLKFDKNSFNSNYTFYSGTQPGQNVSMLIDNIINKNKTEKDHLVELTFDNTSYGTDSDNIKQTKNMIQTFKGYDIQYYEVSMDYDDNGYVNKVTIETR